MFIPLRRANMDRTTRPTHAWHAQHNRGEILRAVISTADQRLDGVLPMDLPGVEAVFLDELDLLGALSLKWHTRLAARIERELTHGPTDLEAAVIAGWRATARDLAGVRLILDHYLDHPTSPDMAQAISRSHAKEQVMLAVLAGKAPADLGLNPDAARVGALIEERARAGRDDAEDAREMRRPRHADVRPGLLDRLKAALAA
jgi:hypothetical protein